MLICIGSGGERSLIIAGEVTCSQVRSSPFRQPAQPVLARGIISLQLMGKNDLLESCIRARTKICTSATQWLKKINKHHKNKTTCVISRKKGERDALKNQQLGEKERNRSWLAARGSHSAHMLRSEAGVKVRARRIWLPGHRSGDAQHLCVPQYDSAGQSPWASLQAAGLGRLQKRQCCAEAGCCCSDWAPGKAFLSPFAYTGSLGLNAKDLHFVGYK